MTPTQLRAFAAVVRLGSVKGAAGELEVSESAVSLHIAQLRRELGDRLFLRTSSGIAFTPGGLRLASRAAELLGLQDRTIREVSQAGSGRRLLRVAASTLFAEYSAPGLIELFAGRAQDLDVELSVHDARDFARLLLTRAIDVAIGPAPGDLTPDIRSSPLLNYTVAAVVGVDHALTRVVNASVSELQDQVWLLGPSATQVGRVSSLLRRLNVPEANQQIFQSHAAALDEAKRGKGVALGLQSALGPDLADGTLHRVSGTHVSAQGVWNVLTLAGSSAPPSAAEFTRFVATPRATQAMLRGSGVNVGRFRPSIHVTLWS